MVTGLLAYIMNYIIGKNKNSRLAQSWFSSHRELLESNFALVGECIRCFRYSIALFFNKKNTPCAWLHSLWSRSCVNHQQFVFIGDDGTSKEAVSTGKLNQENEHIYNLWCSGRVCCEGMLIQLKVWETCCVYGVVFFTVLCLINTVCNALCGLFQFLKRQDLLNVLARMMRPACDQVVRISQMAMSLSSGRQNTDTLDLNVSQS